MAHGLSCSAACGIFPDQGSNPCPLHWQAILNHCATREVLSFIIDNFVLMLTQGVLHQIRFLVNYTTVIVSMKHPSHLPQASPDPTH